MHPSVVLFAQELCAGARVMLADVDVIWDTRLRAKGPPHTALECRAFSVSFEEVPGLRRNTQTNAQAI